MSKQVVNVMMAVAKGKGSSEEFKGYPKYIGIAPCRVEGINPNKKELEAIYSTPDRQVNFDKEPEYITMDEAGVKSIRITIYVRTMIKGSDISFIHPVSYFLRDAKRFNRDKTKVQMVNLYGDFAWIPIEDAKAGRVPENMKWFLPEKMRAAYIGEEDLVNLIKVHNVIPNRTYKDRRTGQVVAIPNPAEAECQLDNIANYFKGDISELKSIFALWPDSLIKYWFGVRTTDDNKEYQDVFTSMPLKNAVVDYTTIKNRMKEAKESGRFPNTYFGENPAKFVEYKEEPTDFGKEEEVGDISEDFF